MPSLDDMASWHFTFRALCEAGSTWRLLQPDNTPKEPETWAALAQLATGILDPLWDQFGRLEITYGHAGANLYRKIQARAAHELDQHAGFERNRYGRPICLRLGQAVDFRIAGHGSLDIARHIVATLAFDKLYYYGRDRPLHVSIGPAMAGDIRLVQRVAGAHRPPRSVQQQVFLANDPGF